MKLIPNLKRTFELMCKRNFLLLSFLLLLPMTWGVALNNQAQAQDGDIQIGYVDPQAILSKMPEMKAVQQRLQNFAQRKQEEMAQKEAEFRKKVEQFEQQSAVMSEEAKKKQQKQLGELNVKLQEYQSQIQQEMQKKQQELVGPLLDQIQNAVDTVAKKQGLTYVLNTTTRNGDVIILYASDTAQEKYDITDAVMRELGI